MMASHPHNLGRASALPLAAALKLIPSLPRPLLARLVERAIERMDEMDGDCDLEDGDCDLEDGDQDFCLAGDDAVFSGPAVRNGIGFPATPSHYCLNMDEDMERESWPTIGAQSDVN